MKRMNLLNLRNVVALSVCIVTPYANASIVSADWRTTNDNLITRDTVNGLDWLDLTITRNYSYNGIVSRMYSGGSLDGWRYATSSEVIKLWEQFGVDLTEGATFRADGEDAGVIQASQYLGNTYCAYDCTSFPYGVFGITEDNYLNYLDGHNMLGAYYYSSGDITQYSPVGASIQADATTIGYLGSYLVQTSAVPIPASAWLFGSGILSLIGFSRRNIEHK